MTPAANIAVPRWKGVTPGLVLGIAAILAGLFAIDRFLANLEQSELRNQAAALAAEGSQLLTRREAASAARLFQRAHALVRDNRGYALNYAGALLAAGEISRAKSTLEDVLDEDSNDARANLLMARAMVSTGNSSAASSYYHRAIYGTWPSDAQGNSIRVRLELTEWLAKRRARDELLAELISLQAAAQNSSAMTRKLAPLFLVAGAAGRAADEYRTLIGQDRNDIEAYEGLGEAELAGGNYRAAQRAFRDAKERRPDDAAIQLRLDMVSRVNLLDPTPRRLTSLEKYARSMRLVELAQASLENCARPGAVPQVADSVAQANQLRAGKLKGAVTNELAEARLALAERLWRARLQSCAAPAEAGDPLAIVMNKLMGQ